MRIRDTVVIGVEADLRDRRSLAEAAVERGVLVRDLDGRSFSPSSVYRYIDALRFLRFDIAPTRDEPIVWSQAARELTYAARETQFTNDLSDLEKRILGMQILDSKACDQFLIEFMPSRQSPPTIEVFAEKGVPLYVRGVKQRPAGERAEDVEAWPSNRVVEVSQDPTSPSLVRRAEMEFLYTYRLWCLDVELIEEVHVREAARYDIAKERSHVMYPVHESQSLGPAELLDEIYKAVGNTSRPVAVPLPRLLYTVCVDLRLRVARFYELLVRAWEAHRGFMHLERAPGVLIAGIGRAPQGDHSDRLGNQRYYLEIDGTIRSTLILSPRKK